MRFLSKLCILVLCGNVALANPLDDNLTKFNLKLANQTFDKINLQLSIQNLDTNTGKTIWTFPAEHYYLGSAVRYKDGYAVEYWSGDNMDYVSGVLMINNEGKLQHNYLIKRGE